MPLLSTHLHSLAHPKRRWPPLTRKTSLTIINWTRRHPTCGDAKYCSTCSSCVAALLSSSRYTSSRAVEATRRRCCSSRLRCHRRHPCPQTLRLHHDHIHRGSSTSSHSLIRHRRHRRPHRPHRRLRHHRPCPLTLRSRRLLSTHHHSRHHPLHRQCRRQTTAL